jgi:hypothetical protein
LKKKGLIERKNSFNGEAPERIYNCGLKYILKYILIGF